MIVYIALCSIAIIITYAIGYRMGRRCKRPNCFITGSRAFGEPRNDSDIDVVIHTDRLTAETLWSVASHSLDPYRNTKIKPFPDHGLSVGISFGTIDLIVCTTEGPFNDWYSATKRLKQRRPVGRDEAIKYIDEYVGERDYYGNKIHAISGKIERISND